MLCRICRFSHTEHNKIGFAIFGFFYDLIWILQVAAKTHKRGRTNFHEDPWKVLKDHR
jgi:hypothetical protein